MATKNTAPVAAKEITPEHIAEWKKKHGKVFRYESVDGKAGYLRRPTRAEFSAANVIGGIDAIKIKETLLRNCWLGGDMELQTEDRYFYGLAGFVDELVGIVLGELKEV